MDASPVSLKPEGKKSATSGVIGVNAKLAVTLTVLPGIGELGLPGIAKLGSISISINPKAGLSEVLFLISVVNEVIFRGLVLTTANLAPYRAALLRALVMYMARPNSKMPNTKVTRSSMESTISTRAEPFLLLRCIHFLVSLMPYLLELNA
jgi:hypothetical protein